MNGTCCALARSMVGVGAKQQNLWFSPGRRHFVGNYRRAVVPATRERITTPTGKRQRKISLSFSSMAIARRDPSSENIGEDPFVLHSSSTKHCDTCSCEDDPFHGNNQMVEGSSSSSTLPCGSVEFDHGEPLPPPLPEPKVSVRRRIMPEELTPLNSSQGRRYLVEALTRGTASSYIALSEHYVNQSDPAFCGATTLLMVLNAFCVDPNVRWRGGWRYFGDEETLLHRCCLTTERVRRVGITMEEFHRLASCQGLGTTMKRPHSLSCTVDEFREDVRRSLCEDTADQTLMPNGIVVVSFGRSGLGQTGDGHFSPVAAYHEESDQILVLDVARFKYQPYWVKIDDMFHAMGLLDSVTSKPRGWYLLFPPKNSSPGRIRSEDSRPAHLVPRQGEASLCPIHDVKVEFCKVRKESKNNGHKSSDV